MRVDGNLVCRLPTPCLSLSQDLTLFPTDWSGTHCLEQMGLCLSSIGIEDMGHYGGLFILYVALPISERDVLKHPSMMAELYIHLFLS